MAREIPEVVRAAAGLAATVLDEARKLPETLPGLPVRLIGLAMQHAMKVQQQYAGLVARGDELFTGLRGEDEPGLATFDDDEEEAPAAGYRESAFDRAGDTGRSADVDLVLDEAAADAQEAPDTEQILEEIAIDELVEQAPTLEQTDPGTPAPAKKTAAPKASAAKKAAPAKKPAATAAKPRKAAATDDATSAEAAPVAANTLDAEPTADVATTVDVLTPAGDVTTVEATVTDEGVAAPESDTGTGTATATDEGGAPVAAAAPAGDAASPDSSGSADTSSAPRNAPVDGYDAFSVAQLRGRMRGYALSTVQDLVDYEQATRNRAPYLTMLRNRLEKLEEQAIESSPLAPRGV